MEYIIKYLSNPLKTGVWRSQIEIDFTNIRKLFEYISKSLSREQSRFLINFIEQVEKEKTIDAYFQALDISIFLLKNRKDCPEELLNYISPENVIIINKLAPYEPYYMKIELLGTSEDSKIISELFHSASWHAQSRLTDDKLVFYIRDFDIKSGIFYSRIIKDISEVLLVDVIKSDKNLSQIINLISIKKDGVQIYKKFLESIPFIGEKIKIFKEKKTYSTRYIFEPYPLAIQLWLEDKSILPIPKDLTDFIKGAINYYNNHEWRTSIVLSAITVESILADVYEETKKDYAPNIPLGSIYHEIKEVYPEEIQKAIEIVNEARISAVHRSRYPVSDKEATNALVGATTLIMWYIQNF